VKTDEGLPATDAVESKTRGIASTDARHGAHLSAPFSVQRCCRSIPAMMSPSLGAGFCSSVRSLLSCHGTLDRTGEKNPPTWRFLFCRSAPRFNDKKYGMDGSWCTVPSKIPLVGDEHFKMILLIGNCYFAQQS
jgi:hypothetical protein